MKKDLNQLQRELNDLDNNRELARAISEIENIDKEVARLEEKKKTWTETKRKLEADLLNKRHELERQIEEAKAEQSTAK